jgi:hypothetical protein
MPSCAPSRGASRRKVAAVGCLPSVAGVCIRPTETLRIGTGAFDMSVRVWHRRLASSGGDADSLRGRWNPCAHQRIQTGSVGDEDCAGRDSSVR